MLRGHTCSPSQRGFRHTARPCTTVHAQRHAHHASGTRRVPRRLPLAHREIHWRGQAPVLGHGRVRVVGRRERKLGSAAAGRLPGAWKAAAPGVWLLCTLTKVHK